MSAGSRTRTVAVAMTFVLGAWAMSACAQAQDSVRQPDVASPAMFPAEIHGLWDLAPAPCVVEPQVESDSRLGIGPDFIRGYEELMEVREVARISDDPPAWRVLTVSDIAPPELQGPALYVLSGDWLTIADSTQARSYVRCRNGATGRDAP